MHLPMYDAIKIYQTCNTDYTGLTVWRLLRMETHPNPRPTYFPFTRKKLFIYNINL